MILHLGVGSYINELDNNAERALIGITISKQFLTVSILYLNFSIH